MTIFLIAFAFALSAILSFRACEPNSALYIADIPNERSLHNLPKARSGGIGIVVALILGGIGVVADLATPEQKVALIPLGQAVLFVAVVSFIDDLYGVPAAIRMPLHLSAAWWVLSSGWLPESLDLPYIHWQWPTGVAALVALLYVAWMINLYNFMDGMDGFSGAMAVVGFGTFGIMGWMSGDLLFAALGLLVAIVVLGFLLFNFPPSHLFMGDTGACVLGFLAAVFSLWAVRDGICGLWSALVLFLPFSLDATITLLGRISRLERVWEGQRNHFYHWLLLRVGHRKALFAHYPLMVGCALVAIAGRHAGDGLLLLLTICCALVFALFYAAIVRQARENPMLPEMVR